jgi:exodeoxyribonuclease V beta subunit
VTGFYPRPPGLPPADRRLLVVEASAGTGKTFFLEHRVADLVLAAGATIDQVLLVTFTEKATAELRARIRALLGALEVAPPAAGAPRDGGWAIDAAARARVRAALVGFDRAPIHTIHAFCQRILVEDAFAGRRLFDQTQVADEVAFDDAYRAALREALAVDPCHRALLRAYLADHDLAALHQLLFQCVRKDTALVPALPADLLAAAAAALRPSLPDGAPLAAGLDAAAGDPVRVAEVVAAWAVRPDALAEAVAGPGAGPDPAVAEAARALLRRAPGLEIAVAHAFLPEVAGRLRARKAARGQFDYQDMLRLVAEILDGPRGDELAARLRARHPWAMIDEFQDTDELQWRIFRRIWLDDGARGLTLVGDPKQAIYSFRGADVHTYLEARAEMADHGVLPTRLIDNYRSSPALIDALNHVIGGGGPGAGLLTGAIGYDAPVRAATTIDVRDPAGRPPITVLDVEVPSGRTYAGPVHDALHRHVADEIHALLRDPDRRLTLVPGGGRPEGELRARDVFVLTRSNRESHEVAAALRRRGVPCVLTQAEHLFATTEARAVLDLLDAIAQPRNRTARLRAWLTPFFDVPLARLGDLGDVPDAHPLVALLHDWHGIATRRDYEALFDRILDDTRLAGRALVTGLGVRTLANVRHVFELLLGEVARSRCELHELADRLRRWIAEGLTDRPDDSDVQRIEHDGDAVEVMTVHRAKGLEAAVVFVVGGDATPPSRDRVACYHDADGRRVAHVGKAGVPEAIADEAREEYERLCYVAMTRARVRLYLSRHRRFGKTAPFAPIVRALDAAGDHPGVAVEHVPLAGGARPPARDLGDLGDLGDEPWDEAAPPARLAPARRGLVVTSYTRLHRATTDDFRADDDAPPVIEAVSDGELPPGADTGLFLHEVLEHADFAAADGTDLATWRARPEVRALLDDAAARHGLTDPRHVEHGARLVHATLTRPFEAGDVVLPPLCRAPRIAREVEFTYPLPGGRGFAKGFIDLLVAWDERVWVVDYKSNVVPDPSPDAARRVVEDTYDLQRKIYAIAAARMLGARDPDQLARRFGGVVFWFLRPQLLPTYRPTFTELTAWYDQLEALADRAAAEP